MPTEEEKLRDGLAYIQLPDLFLRSASLTHAGPFTQKESAHFSAFDG
jgi:hypothetical protein